MIFQALSLTLFVVSAFVLALIRREKISARKKSSSVERKKKLEDLVVLAEQQLKSLELGNQKSKRGTVKGFGKQKGLE